MVEGAGYHPGPLKFINPSTSEEPMKDSTKTTEAATHTPGPWKVGGHPWNIVAESGLVASAQFRGYTPTALERAEVDANARLIAAAPDLLEASEALADLMENPHDYPDSMFEAFVPVEAIRKAHEILARLRGAN